MATRQYSKILGWGILFFFSGCHSVTQDELNGTGLAPDPIFEYSRDMVITPVSIPEGEDRVHFVWMGSLIDNILFNYLQFAQSMPGTLYNVSVKNASDILDFYGADDPSVQKQTEIFKKTLDDNKAHWLMVMPEKEQELVERYSVPSRVSLNISRGKETPLFYFDKKMIVVQSSLDRDMNLSLSIYDSLSSKTLNKATMTLPKGDPLGTMDDQIKIEKRLKPLLKKMLEKLTDQKMFEISIPSISKDLGVYAEGRLVLEPSFFLSQGKHRIYVSQMGNILMQGIVNVEKDGKLSLEDALKKQEGEPISIQTTPSHAPLFIDEQYIGLSPTTVVLPSGEYHLRTSFSTYAHINYILRMDSAKPLKTLNLNFSLVDQGYENRVQRLRRVKIGTFFGGILGIGALLYSYERTSFYQAKMFQGVDVRNSQRRYNQFLAATIGFGVASTGLILTSAIFQLLEYQSRDIGIGLSEDGNLGIRYSF